MSHECAGCGETFDTLTEKRLHDCSGGTADAASTPTGDEHGEELATFRERVADGEFDALYGALATFEAAQDAAGEDPDAYRELFREYFEPFADGLDRFAREEGWSVLAEFVEAYHPRTAETFPHVSPVIENAVGRFVIRTRLEDGVAAIPGEALAYLRAIPSARPSGADAAFEEAGTYGWGIGHPEEPVADHLHEAAEEHRFWVSTALEAAFHADQAAAADLLARIATDDDIEFRVQHAILPLDATRFFLASAAAPDAGHDSGIPRYWDWQAAYDYTFRWDPDVRDRIRDLARETGAAEELPADWEIADLAI